MIIPNCVLSNISLEQPLIEGSSIEIDEAHYARIVETASVIFNFKKKPNEPPIEAHVSLLQYVSSMNEDNEMLNFIKEMLQDPAVKNTLIDSITATAVKQWKVTPIVDYPDPFTGIVHYLTQVDLLASIIPLFWLVDSLYNSNIVIRIGEAIVSNDEYISTFINFIIKCSLQFSYQPRNEIDELYLKTFKFRNVFKVSPIHRKMAILNAIQTAQGKANLLNHLKSQEESVNQKLTSIIPFVEKLTPQYIIWSFLIQNIPNKYPDCCKNRFILQMMLQTDANLEEAENMCNDIQTFSQHRCLVPNNVTIGFLNDIMSRYKRLFSKMKNYKM